MPPPRVPLSNPAQRLYDVLERHAQVLGEKGGQIGWTAVWQETLEVEGDEVIAAVSAAFGLIADIDRALNFTDDDLQRRQYQLHHKDWSKAFVPSSSGQGQQLNDGAPSEPSRVALGSIASYLSFALPEGRVPTQADTDSLRESVLALWDELTDDDTLPDGVRNLLLLRLSDLVWALNHVSILGSDGVKAACERLAMAYAWADHEVPAAADEVPGEHESRPRALIRRAREMATRGYQIVAVPGVLYSSYQALDPVISHAAKLIGH